MEFGEQKSAESELTHTQSTKDIKDTKNKPKMAVTTSCMPSYHLMNRYSSNVFNPSGTYTIGSSGHSPHNLPLDIQEIEKTDPTPPSSVCSAESLSHSPRHSEGPEFVKLRSCEKRRFKKALAQGFSREDALVVAKAPKDTKVACKRHLQDTATQQLVPKKLASRGIVNMGIVPMDLYNRPFDSQAMASLQEAIIDAAIEMGSHIKPEFEGCYPRKGWLMVVCTNSSTANWLRANTQIIKDKSQLELKVIDEEDFPRAYHAHASFPNSQGLSNDKILGTIEAQNNLKASTWKVLQRKWSEGSHIELFIEMDSDSWRMLKKTNGRIAYRFGHIKLQLKDNSDGYERETEMLDTSKYTAKNFMKTEKSHHREYPKDDLPSTSRQAAMYGPSFSAYFNKDQSALKSSPDSGSLHYPAFTSNPTPTLNQAPMPLASSSWIKSDPSLRFKQYAYQTRAPLPYTSTQRESDDSFKGQQTSQASVNYPSQPFTRRSNYPGHGTTHPDQSNFGR